MLVSPFTIHRHPEIWPTPDEFDPLRFSPDKAQTKYSYIPFGGGHHLCIGMNLSLIEAQLILASMARKFTVRPVPGHPVEMRPSLTLRMENGFRATVSRRAIPEAARLIG